MAPRNPDEALQKGREMLPIIQVNEVEGNHSVSSTPEETPINKLLMKSTGTPANTRLDRPVIPNKAQKIGTYRRTIRAVAVLSCALIFLARISYAGDDVSRVTSSSTSTEEWGAPLPLHDVEGNGGIMVTQSAYIVNPPREGQPVGLPSIGEGFISLGHGQILMPTTVTWSPLSRVELG